MLNPIRKGYQNECVLALLAAALVAPNFDAILDDPKLDGAVVAAIVTDGDGKVIYERNSRMRVMPASNMKLLTTSFALHQLGPSWRAETRIWKEPSKTYVETTGDPMLTYDKLVAARESLRLDRRLPVSVSEPYHPGWGGNWELSDLGDKFAAPVAAFTVDRGSFELWAKGGRLELRPDTYGTKIAPSQTLPKGTNTRYDPFKRTIFARPNAFAKDGRVDTLSLPQPDGAAASLLGSGIVRSGDLPRRNADLVIPGPSAIEIVAACLPPSDNQLAEQLLMLGANTEGPLGLDEYATARPRLKNFLTRIVGIDPNDVKIDDGSGLSRHNMVTARALARLLAWADRQPTAAAWRAAMAHPGKGTLASRLKGIAFEGKTGSLDLVAALSGYVETAAHEKRIVSIVVNHYGGSGGDAREVMDRFVAAAAQ